MGLAHPLVGQHVVPPALAGAGPDRGGAAGRQCVVDRDLLFQGAGGGRHLVEDLLAEPDRGVDTGVDHRAHVLAHHDGDGGHRPQTLGEHREVVLVGDDPGPRVVRHADRLAGGHDPTAHAGPVVDLEVLHRRGPHPEGLGQDQGVALPDDTADRHGDPRRFAQRRDRAPHRGEVALASLGVPGAARAVAGVILVHEVSSLVLAAPPTRAVGTPAGATLRRRQRHYTHVVGVTPNQNMREASGRRGYRPQLRPRTAVRG